MDVYMKYMQKACDNLATSEKKSNIRLPEAAVIQAAMRFCGYSYNTDLEQYERIREPRKYSPEEIEQNSNLLDAYVEVNKALSIIRMIFDQNFDDEKLVEDPHAAHPVNYRDCHFALMTVIGSLFDAIKAFDKSKVFD